MEKDMEHRRAQVEHEDLDFEGKPQQKNGHSKSMVYL